MDEDLTEYERAHAAGFEVGYREGIKRAHEISAEEIRKGIKAYIENTSLIPPDERVAQPDDHFVAPDWRYTTAKSAAKQLGVGRELIEGLAAGKQIRGQQVPGKSGELIWIVSTDDVREAAVKMQAVR